jgi:hypothetical protein
MKVRVEGVFVRLCVLALACVGSLVLAECTARYLGYRPLVLPAGRTFSVEPGGTLVIQDPLLGYRLREGQFQISQRGGLSFWVSIDDRGYRSTSGELPGPGPEIWFLGCSITFGWGVEANETFPSQVQALIPEARVENHGVPGYGALQSLLSLERDLERGSAPSAVVLVYGSLHHRRDVLGPVWRRVLTPSAKRIRGGLRLPVARLTADMKLVVRREDVLRRRLPLSESLAIATLLETGFDGAERRRLRPEAVSLEILQRLFDLTNRHGVRLLVAGIQQDPATKRSLRTASELGLAVVDVSTDLSRPGATLAPLDGHPSQTTYAHFAARVAPALRSILLTSERTSVGRSQPLRQADTSSPHPPPGTSSMWQ